MTDVDLQATAARVAEALGWEPLENKAGKVINYLNGDLLATELLDPDWSGMRLIVEAMQKRGWIVMLTATHHDNLQACRICDGSAAPFPAKELIDHASTYLCHNEDIERDLAKMGHTNYKTVLANEQAKTMPEAVLLAAAKALDIE